MAGSSPAPSASSREATAASTACSPAVTSSRHVVRSTSLRLPGSAAGPDVREMVLGSEGRFGILTDVIVRTSAIPALERFDAYLVPDWERALDLARRLAQGGLPLSMVRVSTPLETATTFALAPRWAGEPPPRAIPGHPRHGRRAVPRHRRADRAGVGRACDVSARSTTRSALCRGIAGPGVGPAWRKSRFAAPYLRNALWDAGYAVDTLETAVDWRTLPVLAAALGRTLRHGLDGVGERVHAFSHLSHAYPDGFEPLHDATSSASPPTPTRPSSAGGRSRPRQARSSAHTAGPSATSTASASTTRPTCPPRRAPLGMEAIESLVRTFDPDGRMAPRRPARGRRAVSGDRADSRSMSGRRASARSSSTPPGRSLAVARIPIEPYVSPQPGWAEQDPELYWRSLGDACRQVLAGPGRAARRDRRRRADRTARHGRRHRRGRPAAATGHRLARPAPRRGLPLDRRADRARVPGAGVSGTVAAFMAECEANWLRANEPDTWRAIRRYMLLSVRSWSTG